MTAERPTMLITPAALLAAGYRKYDQHDMDRYKRHLYQKRVRNFGEYTLCFINFTEWCFPDRNSMSVEADLFTPTESMRLSLHLGETDTVESVEAFYARVHAALGCVADRDNQ